MVPAAVIAWLTSPNTTIWWPAVWSTVAVLSLTFIACTLADGIRMANLRALFPLGQRLSFRVWAIDLPGDDITVEIEATNLSPFPVTIENGGSLSVLVEPAGQGRQVVSSHDLMLPRTTTIPRRRDRQAAVLPRIRAAAGGIPKNREAQLYRVTVKGTLQAASEGERGEIPVSVDYWRWI